MKECFEISDVSIKKFCLKGYGIGTLPNGAEVEVAHSMPGDQVRIEWKKKKRGPQKGRLLEVIEPSKDRIAPCCAHASLCGGCSWQQVDYAEQLKEKERRIRRAFGQDAPMHPIIPCEHIFGYRNKMEFSFSQNRGGTRYLGLMIAQAEPYVFNLTECHLCPSWFALALSSVRDWWQSTNLSAYSPYQDLGTLRYLTLREAISTGQKMAVLNISGRSEFAPSSSDLATFVSALRNAIGEISIFLRIHQAKKGRPTQFYEMHLNGSDHIIEILHLKRGELSFKISPISFFQPNTWQAQKLYDAALDFLSPSADVIYDLYSGTGTLAMAASCIAQKVVGIEFSPEAILDAEENLKRNGIENVSMQQGDVGKVLTQLTKSSQFCRPDAVFIDPPRAGLDVCALQHLKNLMPKKIVYISCNPLTQAENVRELVEAGYRLVQLQPVDQFPQTYHIENIAYLER